MADNNFKQIDKLIFSERLRELLNEKNETVYTIAELTHLSAATISRYINGLMAPKITTIQVISSYFNVNPVWLMGYAVPKRLESILSYTARRVGESVVNPLQNAAQYSLSVIYDLDNKTVNHAKLGEITQKYERLDKYGKEMVDMVLDKEYRRCSAMEASNTNHLTPIAAHNDNADDEEQQKLMQQDIDEL